MKFTSELSSKKDKRDTPSDVRYPGYRARYRRNGNGRLGKRAHHFMDHLGTEI